MGMDSIDLPIYLYVFLPNRFYIPNNPYFNSLIYLEKLHKFSLGTTIYAK
jgi:hypothetical protein